MQLDHKLQDNLGTVIIQDGLCVTNRSARQQQQQRVACAAGGREGSSEQLASAGWFDAAGPGGGAFPGLLTPPATTGLRTPCAGFCCCSRFQACWSLLRGYSYSAAAFAGVVPVAATHTLRASRLTSQPRVPVLSFASTCALLSMISKASATYCRIDSMSPCLLCCQSAGVFGKGGGRCSPR